MTALQDLDALTENPFAALLRTAGAQELADLWNRGHDDPGERPDPEWWQLPDSWLERDHEIDLGARTLSAVETPGHTPGHFVFADQAAGLLFAGDHVLPTITPSIGFTFPAEPQPLGDFMASLTKVRGLPDMTSCPRTARSRRRRTSGSTSCSRSTRSGSRCACQRCPPPGPRWTSPRPWAGPGTRRRTRSSTSSRRAWPRWRPRLTSTCSSLGVTPRVGRRRRGRLVLGCGTAASARAGCRPR